MRAEELKIGATYELSPRQPVNARFMPFKEIYDITVYKGKMRVYFFSSSLDGATKGNTSRHHHGNDMLAEEFAERVIREMIK